MYETLVEEIMLYAEKNAEINGNYSGVTFLNGNVEMTFDFDSSGNITSFEVLSSNISEKIDYRSVTDFINDNETLSGDLSLHLQLYGDKKILKINPDSSGNGWNSDTYMDKSSLPLKDYRRGAKKVCTEIIDELQRKGSYEEENHDLPNLVNMYTHLKETRPNYLTRVFKEFGISPDAGSLTIMREYEYGEKDLKELNKDQPKYTRGFNKNNISESFSYTTSAKTNGNFSEDYIQNVVNLLEDYGIISSKGKIELK